MDAKQACDKLNGFNFQNRYLVGTSCVSSAERVYAPACTCVGEGDGRGSSGTDFWGSLGHCLVLYHQPEKMAKSKEDLAERQENLEKLKRQHGID